MRTNYKGIYINNIEEEVINRMKLFCKNDNSFDLSKNIILYYKHIDMITARDIKKLKIYDVISDLEHNLMNLNFDVLYESNHVQRLNILFKKLFLIEGESLIFQTLRRLGEWFLLDHKSAKTIFENIDIKQIPVFNKDKSIFKVNNTELTLIEIIKLNELYINNNSKTYKLSDIINFLEEAIDNLKDDNEFKLMRNCIWQAHIESKDNLSYLCWKDKGSSYGISQGSQKLDNFLYYESKIITPRIYHQIYTFDKIELNDNYDYCNIGIGLGPHKKIRYVYSTSNMIQNYFHFIRVGMSKYYDLYKSDERVFINSLGKRGKYCPLRTDNQSEIYNMIVRENLLLDTIISFDISKYSDYLLVQLLDLIADLTIEPIDLREDFKKALRMPVKFKNKYYHALFGTFMGVKGNFDFITKGNLAIVKIAEFLFKKIYNKNLIIFGVQVVGDDILLSCNDSRFAEFLRFIYSIFNCKINENKANVADSIKGGTFSFTKKYYRVNLNNGRNFDPISGIPVNLIFKNIHSFNWFTSIKNNLIQSSILDNELSEKLKSILYNKFHDIRDEYICEVENINYNNYINSNDRKDLILNHNEEFKELFNEYLRFPLELGGFNEKVSFIDIISTDIGKRKIINLLSNNNLRYDIFNGRKNNIEKLEKLIEIFGIDHPLIKKYLLEDNEIQRLMIRVETNLYVLMNNKTLSETIKMIKYQSIKRDYMKMINLEFRSVKEENQDKGLRSVINRTNKYYYEDKFIKNLRKVINGYPPVNPLITRIVMKSKINLDHASIILEMISLNGGQRTTINIESENGKRINDFISSKIELLGLDICEFEESLNSVNKNIDYFKRDLRIYVRNELEEIIRENYRDYYIEQNQIDLDKITYEDIDIDIENDRLEYDIDNELRY
jgi:hypothetical protein